MENIQLENGRIIESHDDRNVDTAQVLLARQEKGQGYMMSESDIRFDGIQNYDKHPEIADNYFDSITLSATKGKIVKVILPYETGSRTLTEVARFDLGLINPYEGKRLVDYGVDLDIEDRWERQEGSGVYTFQREELELDKEFTEEEAQKDKLILTKLGHPDYVEKPFLRVKGEKNKSIEEIQKLIHNTFELGKSEYGYNTMMGQYMSGVINEGVLDTWYVYGLDGGAVSDARTDLDSGYGRFAFDSVGDAKTNVESVVQKKEKLYSVDNIKNVLREKGLMGIEKILVSGLKK